MNKSTYERDRSNLLKAIDIALYCFKVKPLPDILGPGSGNFTDSYHLFKEMLLKKNSKKGSKSSLDFYEESVFTFFNENTGPTVELFWAEILRENLPYQRKSFLTKIMKRKRIKDDAEYDYVKDVMVAMLQERNISQDDYELLSKYITSYEAKFR